MKLGGLFSGIGGFELAWTQLGHEVAWMCEIDRSARKVLEARFPGVPIYEDVEQLDPAEVEAVDVLTGGSPCQGFSVAGTRSGLEHGESRLFADYIRIMDGLAERGLKWALWENVPGVLSITNDDGERTFEHVVTALVGGTEPVRLGQGRWNTGLADGGGRAVAWRVLDSRYFGVAQRRRRVFACVAFGGVAADRAGRALLAKSEGVSGDSQAGRPQGEGAAGGVAAGVGGPSGVAHTLTNASSKGATEDGTGRGTPIVADVAHTLRGEGFDASEDGTGRGTPLVAQAFTGSNHGEYVEGVGTLRATGGDLGGGSETLATQVYRQERSDTYTLDDQVGTLAARDYKSATDLVVGPQAFRKAARAQSVEDDESWVADGQANTLNTFDMGDTRTTHAIVEHVGTLQSRTHKGLNHENVRDGQAVFNSYGVRRLTPVECERLQAFPDGWTEPAGSDSARYKALGNAVTVNTVRWVLGRMLEQS
jgi:DNA (cytosine-5)-methyltransferase 1